MDYPGEPRIEWVWAEVWPDGHIEGPCKMDPVLGRKHSPPSYPHTPGGIWVRKKVTHSAWEMVGDDDA